MPDYKTMQQDAIKRALEMQSRAQNNSPSLQQPPKQEDASLTPPDLEETTKQNIFDVIFKDSEKTLIIILILIFLSEDSDISLLIALIYLIL